MGQVQAQAQCLQDSLACVAAECCKLARSAQRISSMQGHLQDKMAVNRSRQQVREGWVVPNKVFAPGRQQYVDGCCQALWRLP